MKKVSSIVIRILRTVLLAVLIIFLSQDVIIFPGILTTKNWTKHSSRHLPNNVEQSFVETPDGEKLELWRLPAKGAPRQKKAAIILHGNGGGLHEFFAIQQWFSRLGIPSYGFDYRGFGNSSGWPSEDGIYKDSQTVWDFVAKHENLAAEDIIVFGLSVGTGPAAWLAQENSPGILMLLAPYVSLKQAAADRPLLGLLNPLLWYDFPTKDYVSSLSRTCLVLAHGAKDTIILPYHSKEIQKAFRETGKLVPIFDANSRHNDLFFRIKPRLQQALKQCSSKLK